MSGMSAGNGRGGRVSKQPMGAPRPRRRRIWEVKRAEHSESALEEVVTAATAQVQKMGGNPFAVLIAAADRFFNQTLFMEYLESYVRSANPLTEEGTRRFEVLLKSPFVGKLVPNLTASRIWQTNQMVQDTEEMTPAEVDLELERVRLEAEAIEEMERRAAAQEPFREDEGTCVEVEGVPPG